MFGVFVQVFVHTLFAALESLAVKVRWRLICGMCIGVRRTPGADSSAHQPPGSPLVSQPFSSFLFSETVFPLNPVPTTKAGELYLVLRSASNFAEGREREGSAFLYLGSKSEQGAAETIKAGACRC